MKFREKHSSSKLENKESKKLARLWKKNEPKILNYIQSITRLSVSTEKITCYIDCLTTHGFYGSRTIFLGVKGGITRDDALMVISHELFHVYYWKKIKKMRLTKSYPGTESKKEWGLAEVAAFLITEEKSLKKIWPNANVSLYPEIKPIYKRVKKFWKKGDLEYFLVNSYREIIT